ncbi:hypothetical protein RHMOL_Rhmol01G0147500 [Rhododendron molle]|uniref:Uncharacterized protein n=1 Tax=Rhododendron molle TaxID=49168 RepID=A0ACC0Q195_RHOML|nr:hypothetical protein RHMOL_Rhmol01G0147500 [Rhododendron molle]
MELSVSISREDDTLVQERQDDWCQENSSSSELKTSGEPSYQESNSSVGSPKLEYNNEEDKDEATSYSITMTFKPSNLIAPQSLQVILRSTSNLEMLLDTSLNYLASSQV